MPLTAEFHRSWHDIAAADWDALMHSECPLVSHRFLSLLEDARCVGQHTGWLPLPLTLREAGRAVFAMPLYLRLDSHGEFVFDYAWAHAFDSAGHRYYPKLTTAVPFCPVDGPRYGFAAGADEPALLQAAVQAVEQLAREKQFSSWHVLFPGNADAWREQGLLIRNNCKCFWHNRGYADFDGWLQELNSRRRKSVRRERRLVREQGLRVDVAAGGELGAADWAQLYPLYQSSYFKRGMQGYLTRDFFVQLCERMPDSVVVFRAFEGDDLAAMAFCLRDDRTLYGRHWGCAREFDCLHFELCYYSGIEYCIEQGLQEFDAGVQGCEQKTQRGFEPRISHSAHWLAHAGLDRAVRDFLRHETRHVEGYRDALQAMLPYRRDGAAAS